MPCLPSAVAAAVRSPGGEQGKGKGKGRDRQTDPHPHPHHCFVQPSNSFHAAILQLRTPRTCNGGEGCMGGGEKTRTSHPPKQEIRSPVLQLSPLLLFLGLQTQCTAKTSLLSLPPNPAKGVGDSCVLQGGKCNAKGRGQGFFASNPPTPNLWGGGRK